MLLREKFSTNQRGFILVFTILLGLGVTAIAVGTIYNSHADQITAMNYRNKIQTFSASDGLMTLLAQEILDGHDTLYVDKSKFWKIKGKIWTGVYGNHVSDFTGSISSLPSGNLDTSSEYLGSNWSNFYNYGVKWWGYIIAPTTGQYTFYCRSDDASTFLLSKDTSTSTPNLPAIGSPTCYQPSWENPWPTSGPGVSSPIFLEAGKSYYFEFYHKQGGGGGYGQVGWTGPEWMTELPISGSHLSTIPTNAAVYNVVMVGKVPVRYRLVPAGTDQYTINTEGVMTKAGSSSDTAYRAPLNQLLSVKGQATAPPPTKDLPVIFHDYHSDGSNPEFQAILYSTNPVHPRPYENDGQATPGLVKTNQLRFVTTDASFFGLDSIPKPIKSSTHYAKITCAIDKWFVDWTPGDSSVPQYRMTKNYTWSGDNWGGSWGLSGGKPVFDYIVNGGGPGGGPPNTEFKYEGDDCTGINAHTDTSFKNMKIYDSLTFTRQANGSYQYSNARFFPLDGKGFGNDVPSNHAHNWSFCMEMHTQFQHESGESFSFIGDDDVWLFVNDSLVMDLGFVHNPDTGYINLDDLPLTFGKTYPFDFFYCERNATGSDISLTTNLPLFRPKGAPVASWRRDYGNF